MHLHGLQTVDHDYHKHIIASNDLRWPEKALLVPRDTPLQVVWQGLWPAPAIATAHQPSIWKHWPLQSQNPDNSEKEGTEKEVNSVREISSLPPLLWELILGQNCIASYTPHGPPMDHRTVTSMSLYRETCPVVYKGLLPAHWPIKGDRPSKGSGRGLLPAHWPIKGDWPSKGSGQGAVWLGAPDTLCEEALEGPAPDKGSNRTTPSPGLPTASMFADSASIELIKEGNTISDYYTASGGKIPTD